jgi:hypothetical protein
MKKYKILLIGDYSNCHRALCLALREMGHDVTLMSAGSGFQATERDVDISRREGKLGGALLYGRMRLSLRSLMKGNDIVAIQNPMFVTLRPNRLRRVFDSLVGENDKVFLTAAGTDSVYIRHTLSAASTLRYNELRIGDRPSPMALARSEYINGWMADDVVRFNDYVYERVSGIATVLYEYDLAARALVGDDRVCYCGIPIDTKQVSQVKIADDIDCVKFFLGRHRGRYAEKGTDLLEQAARTIVERHPEHARLEIVENRPYKEYIGLMCDSHVVLDQVYSYTPATNALLAMARGLNIVSGGETDFYDFIGETENRPIINATPDLDELTETLDSIVLHREQIKPRGQRSREFAVKHNDADVVARRFLDFWTK